MESIPFGEPHIGKMGIPFYDEYYECPKCGRTEPSYNGGANHLSQEIDRDILNKIIAHQPRIF